MGVRDSSEFFRIQCIALEVVKIHVNVHVVPRLMPYGCNLLRSPGVAQQAFVPSSVPYSMSILILMHGIGSGHAAPGLCSRLIHIRRVHER